MTASTTTSARSFSDLGVPTVLVDQLSADGKTAAFPIQQDTLGDTLAGRDVLGRGKTGSGKTLAFSIPMVARLAETQPSRPARGRAPRGLILAPTRELATQIAAVLDPLAKACGLTTTTIFGGVKQKRQETALAAGVDIVVACPGRLEDLLQQGIVSLDCIEVTVLDEADHMADMGFLPGVTRLLAKTPVEGQRMFFSATLDNDVDKLVRRFLHNQVLHSVDDPTSHVDAMTHHLFEVTAEDKSELVHRLASGSGRRILFTRTKHRAKRLARLLTKQGIPAVDMHGNLSQSARERNLAAFAEGDVKVLVATDVAARGVHVDAVELVVHVDPPTEHKAYLHRSGRTARAGSAGDVVTIMTPEERKDTLALLRKAKISVKPQKVTADSAQVSPLVGEVAPFVEPQEGQPEKVRGTEAAPAGQAPSHKRSARRRRGRRGTGGQTGPKSGAPTSENTASTTRSSRSGESRTGRAHNGTKGQGRTSDRSRSRSRADQTRGSQSRAAASSQGGTQRSSDARGTTAETRRRNRSRAGGSQQVYSTSS
ncbi:DEAD/DEAH box helicase [Brevibacterium casei]|uniref:DEAD/DEAH box helicase n=1 Tax=Brevibacterium casei TaxID=33889 RepID=UPI000C7741FE|nr:DEAD/DEAH box helicase [Brevibacterium casei]MCT1550809.1 DEAD/DEAH box helicase [Brevibacterium casei]MCT1559114.1 DEAD/DEAH box helicase [Brevibacterium casei]MCT2206971.1 DEAD/DEAH box helicase [Brevibacterium casei]QPR41108.1 DEAD/DEAH box helicase [Brevibacterium casei]QPR45634.1 DEAD/DEAH box helicase [Brevibacterium casei]